MTLRCIPEIEYIKHVLHCDLKKLRFKNTKHKLSKNIQGKVIGILYSGQYIKYKNIIS